MDRAITTRYCPTCIRELALTPKPAPTFVPEWRRRDLSKVMDNGGRAA
jgi:hypothetical protein